LSTEVLSHLPARHHRPGRDRRLRHLLIYLALGAFAFSTIGAFVWTFSVSLKTNPEFISTSPWAPPASPQFGNYPDAWSNANMGRFFVNSVVVSLGATVLSLAVALPAAYVLGRIPFRGSNLVMAVFLIGLMIPWMVTFIPIYYLLEDLHLLNTLTGLVFLNATYNAPFNIFVLTGFMRTLPAELEYAAAVDGATPFQSFWRVIVPLVTPGIASVGIITFLWTWNEFFFSLVMISDPEKFTLPLGLFRLGVQASYGSQWVQVFAGMIITVIPVLVIFGALQERITRGLTAGAVKG